MAWQLLRENSPRGEFARRRVAVLLGASIFVGGLLYAVGLGTLVFFLVGAAAVGGAIALAVRYLRGDRLRPPDLSGVRRFGSRIARDTAPAVAAARRKARDLQPAVSGLAGRAAARARSTDWHGWPYAGAASPVAPPAEQHRRALELNARGAQLRTEGHPDQAAEQHRQALAIFRRLGDRSGEAPTLNSLALALEEAGDTDAAVERFEQALTILRDEGDERHEGRVIANLGFTMLRHGEDDRARDLLEAALQKLDPESRTAQQVVEQLRRAS
jgi:tetratricopeptide (TPR) repeat protein